MRLSDSASHRRLLGVSLFVLGVLLSVTSCGLLAAHARTFSMKRDTAVMIGTTLPALKSSVSLLQANRLAEEFFAKNALAAREEQADVLVLPDGPVATRAVQVLSAIAEAITKNGDTLSITSISFDPAAARQGAMQTVGASLKLTGSFRAVSRFLSVLSFSGDMMVRDVLRDDASEQFLTQIESGTPLSLRAATDFLYTDLLDYVADPGQREQAVLQDMPEEMQADMRAFILRAGLAHVRSSFQGIAGDLRSRHLWPLPLLSVRHVAGGNDQWTVDLLFFRR